MTIKEFIEIVGEDKDYWEQTEIYINGNPVDDVSFGLISETNKMIVNLDSYDG